MADPGESQASEVLASGASVNLVELFQAGEFGIERRRTDNLFKQLDERQLTEDEQSIIQQRVDLQRKMFQEYERREKQRKMRDLQELCPDLDEDAARRALEMCSWKEEDAAERVSSDPAFVRRACGGAAMQVEHAAAPKPDRQRSSGSRAAVGPRPRLVDPSQVGAVFVGRFKSRLGPHQISAMGRQQPLPQPAAGAPAGAAAAPRAAGPQQSMAASATARRAFQSGDAAASSGSPAGSRARQAPAAEAAAHEVADAQPPAQGGAMQQPALSEEEDAGKGEEDVEMADAEPHGAVEPDTVDADEEEGGEAEEDGEDCVDPNSADLTDNELRYEDDVLPVMSPLAGKRQRQEQEDAVGDQAEQEALPTASGQSPVFRYRLVADTSNGNVQSVATEEWHNVLQAQGRGHQQEPERGAEASAGEATAPGRAVAQQQQARGPGDAGVGSKVEAAADDDEVSSPATGQLAKQPASCTGQQQQPASGAAAPAPAAVAPAAAVLHIAPPSVAAAAAAAAASRPRRATAELAAAIRQAESQESQETASDGGDSDFEVSGGGRGGQLPSDAGESSSDDEVEVEEEDSDDLVAPGSRKRRAGAAVSRQQPRKRGTSGGSAAGGATRATRQRAQQLIGVAAAGATLPTISAGDAAAGVMDSGANAQLGEMAAAAASVGASGQAAAAGSGGGDGDSEATVTEDESPGGRPKRQAKSKKTKGSSGGGRAGRGGAAAAAAAAAGGAAISASGHTCRGRVKQKGVKRADLLAVGTLIAKQGWYNAGYIFPAGFRAQTLFRSSVDLDSLTLHTCEILGEGGQYWPAPTFVVTASDRPDEALVAKSCTGCWTAVLRRINGEIEGRRAAGEDLPPPPKTAIAGPEYFGLNQPEICAAIEDLDVERKCLTYWDGKVDREAARGGQPAPARGGRGASAGSSAGTAAATAAAAAPAAPRPPRAPRTSTGGGGPRGRRGGRRGSGEDEPAPRLNEGEEDPEETYAGNRWSAVSRAERYRKRCEEAGEDAASLLVESNKDNPLPGFLDPITLEPVTNPAISPYGHVMGLATWKAVLSEHGRCPFTKQSLKAEALTVLTKNNIERYRSRIIQG